jgi:hypothetical protein
MSSLIIFKVDEYAVSNFNKLKSELGEEPEWSNLRNIQQKGGEEDEDTKTDKVILQRQEELEPVPDPESYSVQLLPEGWKNNLFHSKNGEYNGYLSTDGMFYYTKNFQLPLENGDFNVTSGLLNVNSTEPSTIQMFNIPMDIESINNTITNGKRLEGGKSRSWVKTNEIIVVKTDSSDEEYECNCKGFISGVPLNPPMGFLSLLSGEKVIVEKMIPKNSHTDDFIKCYHDPLLYERLSQQFNALVEKLKTANIGGDFKLDNILFNEDGSFILTDFSIPSCPSWTGWMSIAEREGALDQFTDFKKRLKHYLSNLQREGQLVFVPIRQTPELKNFIDQMM